MAYPTYAATNSATVLHAVEHLDGRTAVYTFPYTPVSQEEAWIFDDLYRSYPATAELPTAAALETTAVLATKPGGGLVKV